MTERLYFHFLLSCIGEGNGNPLQCSCLENPRDGGAWWATVHGVAQSRTRLKRLSSSSSIHYQFKISKKLYSKVHVLIAHKIIENLGIKSRNTQHHMKQDRKLLKDKDIVSYTIWGRVHFYTVFGRQLDSPQN